MTIWQRLARLLGSARPRPSTPVPAPPRETMRAIAAIVRRSDTGQPVVGATVAFGVHRAKTNADGYAAVDLMVPLPYRVEVTADGFQDYVGFYQIGAGSPDLPITLTPSVVPFPRLPVRASFCSSWDRQGHAIFDPQYFPFKWWRWKVFGDEAARDDFYFELERKRRHGVGHVVLDPPDGTIYAGDQAVEALPDWMDNGDLHPLFRAMVTEILALGFVGVFYCFAGGQQDAPAIYDGRLRRMAQRIKAERWTARLIVGWAWESFGRDPECTARQNSDAWQVLWDVLGSEALLFEHVGSNPPQRFTWASFPVEADDPSHGDEIGAHYVGGGKFPGVYFGQLALGIPKPGSYEARLIEGLDRFLETGTSIPAVGTGTFLREDRPQTPVALGPDWFAAPRPGGRMVYCMWEPGLPFVVIRGQATHADVVLVARQMDALGITSQGCLPVGQ